MTVRITLNVTPEYAELLEAALSRGHFDTFPIIAAGIVDEQETEVDLWLHDLTPRDIMSDASRLVNKLAELLVCGPDELMARRSLGDGRGADALAMVTLKLTREQARNVCAAFNNGQLVEFGVMQLTVRDLFPNFNYRDPGLSGTDWDDAGRPIHSGESVPRELNERVQRSLSQLPLLEQTIVLLRASAIPDDEIARKLDIPVLQVESTAAQAQALMRHMLSDD